MKLKQILEASFLRIFPFPGFPIARHVLRLRICAATLFLIGVFSVVGCAHSEPSKKNYSSEEKARMLVEVANGALAEGDFTGALQQLAKAELLNEDIPELHHSRALAYYMKQDLATAIESARLAVQLKPNYSDANNTLGKLLMDAGKSTEAIKYLRVAASDPLYREAYKAQTSVGILFYRTGNLKEAEASLSQAIQSAPALACVAYYYRGHIQLKNKKLKDAVQDYSNATQKFCANFADAYFALGLAYQENKQYSHARKIYLEVQKRYPNTKYAEKALDQLRYLP